MSWNIKNLIKISLFLFIVSVNFSIIIQYKPNYSEMSILSSQVMKLQADNPAIKNIKAMQYTTRAFVLDVSENEQEELIEKLKNNPNIEHVERTYPMKILTSPNDTYYNNYSYYRDTFTSYGAQVAWDTTTGSEQILVAVLDTGVNSSHPDLVGRVLVASGKNYIDTSQPPEDDHSHGTHVAGIIGANSNNGIGITGLDWNAKLLPIKVLDSSGSGNSDDLIDGINYARTMGAKVINLSLGFDVYLNSYLFNKAISDAYDAGIVIVAAAGNSSHDMRYNDSSSWRSPVCNDGANNMIIGVSALNNDKSVASFSNYSQEFVDISAFGVGIWSTVLGSSYEQKNGTSMSAPAVSGIVSLLLGLSPGLTPAQVMDYLVTTAEDIDGLAGNFAYAGKLGAGLIRADNIIDLYSNSQQSSANVKNIIRFYNYPNPIDSSLSASTTFFAEFSKPITNATITVYSLTGRIVKQATIVQISSTHLYETWDGSSFGGTKLPVGPYIALLETNIDGNKVSKYHKVLIK
jgi:subtilisin family serine protease